MQAREAYGKKGASVQYFDVKSDPALLAEMLSRTGGDRRVPVIVEGGRVVIGYGGT